MAVSVGGINIQIGINTGRAMAGLAKISTELRKFEQRISNIKLEGAIKGDPFSAVKNHFKETGRTLDKVFQDWAQHVDVPAKAFSRLEKVSKKTTGKIITQWEKLSSRLGKVTSFGAGKGLLGQVKKGEMDKAAPGAIGATLRQMLVAYKGLNKDIDKQITEMRRKFKKNSKLTVKEMKDSIGILAELIGKEKIKVKSELKEMEKILTKGFRKREAGAFAAQLKEARSVTAALERQAKTKKKLRIEEARLRTEIKAGINVNQNVNDVLKNLEDRKRQGIKLTNKQTRELRRHRVELEKFGKVFTKVGKRTSDSKGIFSAAWFKQRALWFVQLRGFWEIYRGITETVRQLTDYHKQLARAMRTANSATKTGAEIQKEYGAALGEVVRTFNVGFQEGAEVLYQLTSAGLSSEEALAGLIPTMKLIIATEGEARTTTKSMAGIYNNFADSMENTMTKGEKLTRIAQVMTSVWKRHQVEIAELTEGFKFASVGATSLGLGVEEVAGILGVANDKMIKSGRAGRALQNIFMRISRMPFSFARMFDLSIDIHKPLQFMDIMRQLGERFEDGQLSVAEMSAAFERMGLRGAPLFIKLIQNWKEVEFAIKRVREGITDLDDTSEAAMDHVGAQVKRASNAFVDMIRQMKVVEWLFISLKFFAKEFADSFNEANVAKGAQKIIDNLEESTVKGSEGRLNFIRDMEDNNVEALKAAKEILGRSQKILENFLGRTKVIPSTSRLFPMYQQMIKYQKLIEDINDVLEVRNAIAAEDLRLKGEAQDSLNTAKKTTALIAGEEQRLYEWKYKKLKLEERFNILLKEQAKLEGEIAALLVDATKKDTTKISREAAYKEINRKAQILAGTESKLNTLYSEATAESKRIVSEYTTKLRLQIKAAGYEKDALKKQRQELSLQGLTGEELKKAEKINARIRDIDIKKAELAKEIAIWNNQGVTGEFAKKKAVAAANEKQSLEDKKALLENEKYELQKITNLYTSIAQIKNRELVLARITNKESSAIIELERELLENEEDKLEAQIALGLEAQKELEIRNRLYAIGTQLIENAEKLRRATDPLYDVWRRIEEEAKSFKDLIVDVIMSTRSTIASGLSDIAFDITGGFQEQRQEIAELEQELKSLDEQYKEAVGEGNIERVIELKNEMAELNKEINKLKDPIRTIGDAFKDLFKEVIDGVRKMIIEWLIMQAVTGLFKMAVGAVGGAAGGGITGAGNIGSGIGMGTGGVIPNIKAFKSFSRGGITGGTSMAILGDNRSGRELVIPSENINKDSVSGYTRDSKQPINIINIVTPEDISRAMSGVEGQRVIVNRVAESIGNRGVVYKSLSI